MAQRLGLARMGTVAIDSTRVKANASADRVERVEQARQQRARKRRRVRRWQKACDADEGNEGAGTSVGTACEELRKGTDVAAELESLPNWRSVRGRIRIVVSCTSAGIVLGYTGEIAVSQDTSCGSR